MNTEAFNSSAINAGASDSLVRMVVNGYVYALGRVESRVFHSTILLAQAKANTSLAARAFIKRLVEQTVHANTTLVAKAFKYSHIASVASAVATINSLGTRTLVNTVARVISAVVVNIRRRSVVLNQAVAHTLISHHINSPLAASASAQTTLAIRARVFSPSNTTANAVGFIGTHTTIYYPFDMPAIEENTYWVRFVNNTFYVR